MNTHIHVVHGYIDLYRTVLWDDVSLFPMMAVYVARTYPTSVCIRLTQSRHRITVLLCNLIGVFALDVGVEIAFPPRRIVTERTFMCVFEYD